MQAEVILEYDDIIIGRCLRIITFNAIKDSLVS